MTALSESRIPPPVRHALAALEILRGEDAALAATVHKILPGYAKAMAALGGATDTESLLAAARRGPDFLKDASRPQNSVDFMTAYQAITGRFEPSVEVPAQELAALLLADDDDRMARALQLCAGLGQLELARTCIDNGADIRWCNDACLRAAAGKGHSDIVALLLDHGADAHVENDAPLLMASVNGHRETVRLLLDRAGATAASKRRCFAAAWRHQPLMAMLLAENDWADDAVKADILGSALLNDHWEVAALLLDHGADAASLNAQERAQVAAYRKRAALWQDCVRRDPPAGLWASDPAVFKPALFAQASKIIAQEGYSGATANIYAYNAMALFQSEDRILAYLDKWATNGRHALHDLIYMVSLPQDLANANLADWGDAILKHGPQMARLAKYCDRLPSPAKSADGKSWSYTRTRAEVARYAFNRAAEHPALAQLCMEHAIDEYEFDTALKLAKHAKQKSNLPDIVIDGACFGLSGATFKKLADGDIRGLFLGELTDCCQSIGKAGSKCAMHGFVSENGGFYAIETSKGEIIGQSWAWRGTEGELCFDSLETLGGRISGEQWQQLLAETANDLTARRDHDVTALHVGTGGATPASIARQFACHAAKPVDYEGYRDSEKQVRIWKR